MNELRIHFMKLQNEENELKGQKKYMKRMDGHTHGKGLLGFCDYIDSVVQFGEK